MADQELPPIPPFVNDRVYIDLLPKEEQNQVAILNARHGGPLADPSKLFSEAFPSLGGLPAATLPTPGTSSEVAPTSTERPLLDRIINPPAEPPRPGSIRNVTDHAGPDPFQGFDVDVWIQRIDLVDKMKDSLLKSPLADSHHHGGMVLLGQFQSVSIGIKTTAEAYLEFDSRTPIYMDGEVQIVFRLDKGLVDMGVLQETFGVNVLGRRTSYNVLPRFNITFNINTTSYNYIDDKWESELNGVVSYGQRPYSDLPPENQSLSRAGGLLDVLTNATGLSPTRALAPINGEPLPTFQRHVNGRFVLKSCKVNSFNIDAGAGKQVVATQWLGVAEEIVSLAGDPPNVVHSNKGERGDSNAALDTWPVGQANTRLPLESIKREERAGAAKDLAGKAFSAGLRALLG